MARILSEFHFGQLLIDGKCLDTADRIHGELAFKLGLPAAYRRNWGDLLNCLSSIGTARSNLCRHWKWLEGKRLLLSVRDYQVQATDVNILAAFTQVVSDANDRLMKQESLNRIWLELIGSATHAV